MEELSLGLVNVEYSNGTSAGTCEVKVCKVFGVPVFKCYYGKECYLLNLLNINGRVECNFETPQGKKNINKASACMLLDIRQQLKTSEQANSL
mgnify:CR=1 FL=1